MKKYIVTIEQPMVRSTEIEAENIEQAIDKARGMYNRGEIIITGDDIGTDAQVMAEGLEVDEVGGAKESTGWTDL